MTAHVLTDPTTTPNTTDLATDAGWLTLSAALTDEVPPIADREDLVVTIAPGAGQGAPACFMPAHATIEVDGTHLNGVDPASVTPGRIGDRARYPVAWGLLVHECAHAQHSRWDPPADAPAGAVAAALLLEESRIEAGQLRRRPDDRHWLRAAVTNLILADTHADDPARAPKMTPRDAAQAAGLLLARVDAGILTAAETAPVTYAVTAALGTDTLEQLRVLWRAAHDLDNDNDADAMLDLGRRWCEIVGTDPDAPDTPPTPPPGSSSPATGPGAPAPSPLAEAIIDTVRKVRAAVVAEPVPADPATTARAARAAEHRMRETATAAAEKVFNAGPRTLGEFSRITGTQPPTTAERQAARQLGRALTTSGVRDRVTTKTTSPVPPGRLRMRGALAADAQRAAGTLPTAEPFTRTTRRTVPAPPLRLGIACDVSGSMSALAAPVASTAWILANAARHTRVPADTATVIYGRRVHAITHPGTAPPVVTTFDALDDYEDITLAIDALDGALGLSQPGAARLLIIISDGRYSPSQRRTGQQRINRLRATGCAILWLTTHRRDRPLDNTTVHQLTEPTTTARTIARAATTALRTVR